MDNISNEQRKRLLSKAKMKLTENVSASKESFVPKKSDESENYLFFLIEKMENLIYEMNMIKAENQRLLNENHVIPKSSKEVTILIGDNKFKGKMKSYK